MEAKRKVVQFNLKSFSIWLWSHWLRFFPGFVFYGLADLVLNVHCSEFMSKNKLHSTSKRAIPEIFSNINSPGKLEIKRELNNLL